MKLSDFLVDLGNAVAYYPKLVDVTGGVLPNLFLCQMYYWLGKQKNPEGWIYKSQTEIEQETGLTRKEQETARKSLKARGLLKEKFVGCPRRVEFWLDKDALNQRWSAFMNNFELPIEEITKAWTRKSKKDDSASGETKRILPKKDNIDSPNSAICNALTEQYILPEKDNPECPIWTGSNAPFGHTVMPHVGNKSIYTKNTSEITTQIAPPEPGAPPTQECVCEEKSELTSPQNQVQPIPKSPTLLSNKSESLPQTENPSSGLNTPARSFGKVEQPNKPAPQEKAGAQGAGSRGEKPSTTDKDSTKSERKQGNVHPQEVRFVPPVPSSPCPLPPASFQDPFLNNRQFIPAKGTYKSAATDPWMVSANMPNEEFASWVFDQRYKNQPGKMLSDAKAEIRNNFERAGDLWQEFQQQKNPTLTNAEVELLLGYYSNRSLDWHKGTFNELLDLADRVGRESAIAQFTTRYDQQHTGATANWLDWIKHEHPAMYAYLYQQAA